MGASGRVLPLWITRLVVRITREIDGKVTGVREPGTEIREERGNTAGGGDEQGAVDGVGGRGAVGVHQNARRRQPSFPNSQVLLLRPTMPCLPPCHPRHLSMTYEGLIDTHPTRLTVSCHKLRRPNSLRFSFQVLIKPSLQAN